MLVRDVMTSPAVTVPPDMPLKRVAHLLDEHSITALPVVDDDNRIVGVISEADVVLEAVPHDPRTHEIRHSIGSRQYYARAADVMNAHPVTVGPRTDLAEATELMTSTSVKSLPVVDDGIVVGVVSRRDVVHVLAREDELIAADLDELLRGLDEGWLIEVEDGVVLAEGSVDEGQREIVRALAATVPGVVGVRFR